MAAHMSASRFLQISLAIAVCTAVSVPTSPVPPSPLHNLSTTSVNGKTGSLTPGDVVKFASTAFLDILKCVENCDSIEDAVYEVVVPVVESALSLIPVIGPLLSGLFSLLYSKDDTLQNFWHTIQKYVDVMIGTAIRQVKIDWVADDMATVNDQVQRLAKLDPNGTGCFSPSTRNSIQQNILADLDRIRNHIEIQATNPTNPSNPGGTADADATQRALLGFMPQTAMLDITLQVSLLENMWQADGSRHAIEVACNGAIELLLKRTSTYLAYSKTAVDNLVAWAQVPCLPEACNHPSKPVSCNTAYCKYPICLPGQWYTWKCEMEYPPVPRHRCDHMRKWQYSTSLQCGEMGGPHKTYSAQSACGSEDKSFIKKLEDSCNADTSHFIGTVLSNWTQSLLRPLSQWSAFTKQLKGHGYCSAMAQRGQPKKWEQMGTKSFLNVTAANKTKPMSTQAFIGEWRKLDSNICH